MTNELILSLLVFIPRNAVAEESRTGPMERPKGCELFQEVNMRKM